MQVSMVLTVIGKDRQGIVDRVSGIVARAGGNWEASRMARLAEHFAGILLVRVPSGNVDELERDLQSLQAEGLRVQLERGEVVDQPGKILMLEVVGQDRAGIIRDISAVLAKQGVNVEELQTTCSDAPMAGGGLFRMMAQLRVPEASSLAGLKKAIEAYANDLMVDMTEVDSSAEG